MSENNQQHTPEPWKAAPPKMPFPSGWTIVGNTESHNQETDICIIYEGTKTSGPNADRIVACVNACEGINPAAVPLMLRAIVKAKDELADLRSFYGKNLRVAGWHQNGETEPLDNFFDDTDCGATEALEEALAAANQQITSA